MLAGNNNTATTTIIAAQTTILGAILPVLKDVEGIPDSHTQADIVGHVTIFDSYIHIQFNCVSIHILSGWVSSGGTMEFFCVITSREPLKLPLEQDPVSAPLIPEMNALREWED